MTSTTYSVPGMTCGHCKMAIEGELKPLEGVDTVDIDLEAKTVKVEGSATDESIRAAIDEAGYDIVD